MMYQKALLFSDLAVGAQILAASHPKQVKALGRKVHNFDEKVWNTHREEIVRQGNRFKFTRPVDVEDGMWMRVFGSNTASAGGGASAAEGEKEEGRVSIRELLLRTGDREIVEASPMDKIWGIGMGAAKAASADRKRWGLNLLGKALMVVRGGLKEMEERKGKQEKEGGEDESKGDEEAGKEDDPK
ncbi:hypothetical protein N0V88_006469 [Collariella sp. IMI 366227]|nr:hypothetical protein N0V88_006469 [Collariella sp. IMI 366227]